MIQFIVDAIDTNLATKITANVRNYGLCAEIERESQDGGTNRYLIDSLGNAAVTDDSYLIGSAHVLNAVNAEYRSDRSFNISEVAEMQLLVWITAAAFTQHDVYSLFRSVIFATEAVHPSAKNIELNVTRANFKSTEIFRNNYNYFRGNRTTANTPVNITYIGIDYNISAQYKNNKLDCINCLNPC